MCRGAESVRLEGTDACRVRDRPHASKSSMLWPTVQSLPYGSARLSGVGTSRNHPRVGMLQARKPSVASCPVGGAACSTWTIKAGCHEPSNQTAPIVPTVQDQNHKNVERARGDLWVSYALTFPNANFFSSNGCSFSVRTFWFTFLARRNMSKSQTLRLCIQTNIDILLLLALPPIEAKKFQVLKIEKHVDF